MKKLITVLLLFTLSSFYSIEDCPKKANKILIKTELNQSNGFQALGMYLIDKGFEIESNKDFFTISTKPVDIDKVNAEIKLSFVVKDSLIVLTGKHRIKASGFDFYETENRGTKRSPLKLAFVKMYETATNFTEAKSIECIID